MAYVELNGAPANACFLVKCDSCGKTTWKVRYAIHIVLPGVRDLRVPPWPLGPQDPLFNYRTGPCGGRAAVRGRQRGSPTGGTASHQNIKRTLCSPDGSRVRLPSVPKGARVFRGLVVCVVTVLCNRRADDYVLCAAAAVYVGMWAACRSGESSGSVCVCVFVFAVAVMGPGLRSACSVRTLRSVRERSCWGARDLGCGDGPRCGI